MKKTYVLDTNVLLDNPNIIFTLQKNDIIIPYKVIEELDKHKYSPGLIGLNARDCSRIISGLLEKHNHTSLKQGIKLDGGGKLFVKSHKDFNIPEVEEVNADDCIIKVALGYSKARKNIILMSNDMLLKIKANSFGLETVGHDQNVDVKSSDDLYTGYKKIKVTHEILQLFYQNKDKETSIPIEIKDLTTDKLYPNQFIVLYHNENDAKKKPYPLLKYDAKKQTLDYVKERKLNNKIKSMNIEQSMAMELLTDQNIAMVTLSGIAGSGKTALALAAGLELVLEHKIYQNIIIIRPIQPLGKDIGYLPGSFEEKLFPWLGPIRDNLRFILSENGDNGKKSKVNENSVNYLFDNGIIEAEAMTYIRGRSINNAYIIIDEGQNLSAHELKAVLTRIGKNTKVVLTGDVDQTDRNDVDSISNGLSVAIEKFKDYNITAHVTLTEGIRSEISELAAKIL